MFIFPVLLAWGLHFFQLPNGITAFFKESVSEAQGASVRVIVKSDPIDPKVFHFELNRDNKDDLDCFFAQCRSELEPVEQSLSVISIGDFSPEHMAELLNSNFSDYQFLEDKTSMAQEEAMEAYLLSESSSSYNHLAAAYYTDCFLGALPQAAGPSPSSFPVILAKNIPEPSTESSQDPFEEIGLEDWEKKTVYKIITTMAEKNLFQLALEKRSLEKKGRSINHIHPLWFMGYILSDPKLKSDIYVIKKSHFKWDSFIDGFSRRMREESRDDNLAVYVSGFAELLDADPEMVMEYIEDHDWEGLVVALL